MPTSMKYSMFCCLIFIICLIFIDIGYTQSNAVIWSEPKLLFEANDVVQKPIIITDQKGIIHLFWGYDYGTSMAIYYMQKNADGWSNPIDIIYTTMARSPNAVVDKFGNIHLIWQGYGNELFYSKAHSSQAVSAFNWQTPIALDYTLQHGQIITDRNGVLYIGYPKADASDPYLLVSYDNGDTWSTPKPISNSFNHNAFIDFVRLVKDKNEFIHTVWTELEAPDGWPPLGVYYSRSEDHGENWIYPVEIDGPGYLEATILASDDNIIDIAWNAMASISGRYHVRSIDGGESWSLKNTIAPSNLGGGSTDPPSLAVDTNGTLHALINTNPRLFNATMYTYWNGFIWSPPINISDLANDETYGHNEASVMTINQGNLLHVVFYFDEKRIWYVNGTVDAPEITSEDYEIPNPEADAEMGVTPATNEFIVYPTTTVLVDKSRSNYSSIDLSKQIIAGVMPVFVIIAALFIVVFRKKRW